MSRTNCNACGTKLEAGVMYFCRPCWFTLPGNERAAFQSMHARKQDMKSKLAKCVRIIRERKAKA